MCERITKINLPATIALCITFAVSALMVHWFRQWSAVTPVRGVNVATADVPPQSRPVSGPSFRYQPGAPLIFIAMGSDAYHAWSVTVKNTSGRTISALCLAGSYRDHNETISKSTHGILAHVPLVLDVDGSYTWYQNLDNISEVWVDFVEFPDGTTWGPDTLRNRERIEADRAGALTAAQRYYRILTLHGPIAMWAAVPEHVTDPRLAEHDELWRQGFNDGVEHLCLNLLQDKQGVDRAMRSKSNKAYDAALTEDFERTLLTYINFKR